jgi:PAS domain S-box-containing protein
VRPVGLLSAVSFLILALGSILAGGPTSIPLRWLVGPSIRALLLRTILSTVLLVGWMEQLVTGLLFRLWIHNPGLQEALDTLIMMVGVCLVLVPVARRIGGHLDRAEDGRRQAEAALVVANQELEHRIGERTAELRSVNARLEREVQQRAEAEADYRSIFENAPEGIFRTTVEGTLLRANPALARALGYDSPAELMASVTDLAEQHFADREDRMRFLRQVQDRGLVVGFETRVCRKDRSVAWVSIDACAVRAIGGGVRCFEGMVQDITERKQAEETLRQSQERFRALVETMDEGLGVQDANGLIT